MNLLTVVWDFDPTLITIGSFELRYYSVMWAAALLVGCWVFAYFCRREGKPSSVVDTAFLYIALGTIIGARVGHCLFYEPAEYLAEPWKIVTGIRDGGLASHGAAIGILVGIWLSSRKNKVDVMWTADRLGIIAALSGALIRLGNLFNSEIIGTPTDMPWGFKFVRSFEYRDMAVEHVPACHPTQLYEAICYFVVFAVLFVLYRKTKLSQRRGFFFGAGVIGIFLSRFLIEFIKIVQVDFEKGMVLDMGQWLSLPFILIGVISVWYSLRRPPVVEGEKKNDAASTEPKPATPKHVKRFKKR